jgi:hypothetical protein
VLPFFTHFFTRGFAVQVGGLISPGCHGSGLKYGTMCELVKSVEIVDSSGELRCFDRQPAGTDGCDTFEAAVLSLGTFGVIYTVTLQAVDMDWVVAEDQLHKKAMLTDANWLKNIVMGNDVCDLFWWPYTDTVWARLVNPRKAGFFNALLRWWYWLQPSNHFAKSKVVNGVKLAFGGSTMQVRHCTAYCAAKRGR